MGKKRSDRRAAAVEDGDAVSVSSINTAYSMGDSVQEVMDSEADRFSQAIDDTYESRASTREKAWEALVAMLRNNVRSDDCYQNATTLTSRCLSAIRKGGAAEAASAATALALHMLTLGEPSESTFQEMQPDLSKAARQGKGAAAKVAATEALALTTFVAAEDEASTLAVMDALAALWHKDGAKQRAAALRGWAFLYTSLSAPLGARQLEGRLAALAGLLHDDDVDVRSAAGEVLGLLYHSCSLGDAGSDDYDEEDEEEEAEEQAAAELPASQQQGGEPQQAPQQRRRDADAMSLVSSSSSTAASGLDVVMDRVRELAANRGDARRRNRRERVALKGAFRELRGVLEEGRVRAQRIKLRHGDVLLVDSLEGLTMLHYLKRFLAGGFQVHLQTNPLLHQVFGFTPLEERGEKLSSQEKRYNRESGSKARSQARRGARSVKGGGGGGDGW